MRRKIIIVAIVLFLIVLTIPFFIKSDLVNKFNTAISIISGLATFVTVIIAALLFDKYGVDKSIKDKNLDSTLRLLETIKNTTILIKGHKFLIQYRPTTFQMHIYERSYSIRIVFTFDYYKQTRYLDKYSENVYLPKQIRDKLNKLLPGALHHLPQTIDTTEFGVVSIGKENDKPLSWSKKETRDHLDNKTICDLEGKELTVYDYLLMWEELIESIQDWCSKTSDSKIDLNVN